MEIPRGASMPRGAPRDAPRGDLVALVHCFALCSLLFCSVCSVWFLDFCFALVFLLNLNLNNNFLWLF